MTQTNIERSDDNIVLSSTYSMMATSFWKSAEILNNNRILTDDGRTSMITVHPFYYLVSHACELFLKSALLKRHVPTDLLKKVPVRHNLVGLLELLENQGVTITEETKKVLHSLNEVHKGHYLRYEFLDPRSSVFKLPPDDIFTALKELLMSTRLAR